MVVGQRVIIGKIESVRSASRSTKRPRRAAARPGWSRAAAEHVQHQCRQCRPGRDGADRDRISGAGAPASAISRSACLWSSRRATPAAHLDDRARVSPMPRRRPRPRRRSELARRSTRSRSPYISRPVSRPPISSAPITISRSAAGARTAPSASPTARCRPTAISSSTGAPPLPTRPSACSASTGTDGDYVMATVVPPADTTACRAAARDGVRDRQ